MREQGGLTARELIASLRRRHAALPSEIGTYLVFEACEQVAHSGPVSVSAGNVWIDVEGGVRLLPAATPTDSESCARGLHALLTQLLLHARPGLSPVLLQLVERGPSAGRWSPDALRDDLEAALVPLNRTASRRVLARLLREAAADRMRGLTSGPPPEFEDLDAALTDLLGGDEASGRGDEPTIREHVERLDTLDGTFDPPGRPALRHDASFAGSEPPTARLPVSSDQVSAHEPSRLSPAPTPGAPQAQVSTERSLDLPPRDGHDLHPSLPPRSRLGVWLGLGFVALAMVLTLVVTLLRPDVVARLRGEQPGTPTVEAARTVPAPPPRAGELVLEVSPPGSQVLLYVGQAPVEIPNVPVGVPQEFVAMAEGHAPTRALIGADETWESTEQGPYFELAMQTLPLREGREPRLGETLLPGRAEGAARGRGTVRVVTSPRGAHVYRVVGSAPEVRIRNWDVDDELVLRIARDGHRTRELRLGPQDWPIGDGPPVLRERVQLKR